jgi:O-antigen/teichoic acid export membrane protein
MDSVAVPTLKNRVFIAGGWSVAGYGLSQAIRLGSNLLMTRLLVPDMFGLMAIAGTLMVGLAMFSDVGLRQSVVTSMAGLEDGPDFDGKRLAAVVALVDADPGALRPVMSNISAQCFTLLLDSRS